jgi:hypothetical protein
VGDGVADLGKALEGKYPTLQDFIASPDFARRSEIVAGRKADHGLSAIRFLPVIPKPEIPTIIAYCSTIFDLAPGDW